MGVRIRSLVRTIRVVPVPLNPEQMQFVLQARDIVHKQVWDEQRKRYKEPLVVAK